MTSSFKNILPILLFAALFAVWYIFAGSESRLFETPGVASVSGKANEFSARLVYLRSLDSVSTIKQDPRYDKMIDLLSVAPSQNSGRQNPFVRQFGVTTQGTTTPQRTR